MQQLSFTGSLQVLILGLGWTGQFLQEILLNQKVSFAATTRDGRNGTIGWTMTDTPDVSTLPWAQTVLVTFPVMSADIMSDLIDNYTATKGPSNWILMSSTRIFSADPSDRHTPIDPTLDTGRLPAENVVIKKNGTVLHLCGLWGAQRQPKNWLSRFTKRESIKGKILSRQLHLIHGRDIARAILAVHNQFTPGERWLITDQTAIDWLKMIFVWGSKEQVSIIEDLRHNDFECREAIGDKDTLEEIVHKGGVKPRLNSDEFWATFHLKPQEFLDIV
ncbi:hypothetical protein BGW37DRAFT_488096 [Umbelopsis sp. PMI_123]|nr:hypothetical protein BGW37DRAFT_488096 [Umbelopsis sp. PMI_123]